MEEIRAPLARLESNAQNIREIADYLKPNRILYQALTAFADAIEYDAKTIRVVTSTPSEKSST